MKSLSWEDAMKTNYGIEVGQCGSGKPGKSNDNFVGIDFGGVVV